MPRKTDKRERLIKAAKKLIHQKGFNFTTLADIAQEADVPLGNVYYYFKTKGAIGFSVVSNRLADWKERVAQWEAESNPVARLHKLVQFELDEITTTMQFGCPVGSLCQELAKQGGELADSVADLLKQQIDWVESQFVVYGLTEQKANAYAIQLIANLQGLCLLTNTYKDVSYAQSVSDSIKQWIQMVTSSVKEEAFA
jgi:TetR/AcrR family transcriptional repressor of nem operon